MQKNFLDEVEKVKTQIVNKQEDNKIVFREPITKKEIKDDSEIQVVGENNLLQDESINSTTIGEPIESSKPPEMFSETPKPAYISETFMELEKSLENVDSTNEFYIPTKENPQPVKTEMLNPQKVHEPIKENKKINETDEISNLFSNINVDLESIEIDNDLTLDIKEAFELTKEKSVKQVVNCQSAYISYMTAFNNNDLMNLDNSEVDMISFKKKLVKSIYKHIEETSIGKIDFPTFQKITSYFDLETLIYGSYCKTFPKNNKYFINQCPNDECKRNFSVTFNNNDLIETRNKNETFDRINEIIAKIKSPKNILKYSLLSKKKRLLLPTRKIIFEISIPSIFDYLDGYLRDISQDLLRDYTTSVATSLLVKQVLIPNVQKLKETGKLVYIPVKERSQIVKIISELSVDEARILSKGIDSMYDKYRVYYCLKDVTCPHCGHIINEVPLDMQSILFLGLRQRENE